MPSNKVVGERRTLRPLPRFPRYTIQHGENTAKSPLKDRRVRIGTENVNHSLEHGDRTLQQQSIKHPGTRECFDALGGESKLDKPSSGS